MSINSKSYSILNCAALFLLIGTFVISFFFQVSFRAGGNHFTAQAHSWLNGNLDLGRYFYDSAVYQGRYYLTHSPFAAVLLLPFVAIFGERNEICPLLCLFLSFLNFWLLLKIFARLQLEKTQAYWLALATLLGTGYWYCLVRSSSVWFAAHIVTTTALLLGINEAIGKRRGWLLGLFLGCAVLSRPTTIYMMIFFLLATIAKSPEKIGFNALSFSKSRILHAIGLITVFILALGLLWWFNWARFGNIFETGYSYQPQGSGFLRTRKSEFGMFSLAYVPFNFAYMFLQGFHITFNGDDLLKGWDVDPFGTALLWASPFVFCAFAARWESDLKWAAWCVILLTVAHLISFIGNGWVQTNTYRYTLDFIPILMLLVAKGINQVPAWIWKGAIVWSILLNALSIYWLKVLYFWYAQIFFAPS